MAVGEVRPGYELWRPNREKASSVTTKAVMALLLLVTAGLCLLITIGGLSLLEGGAGMAFACFIYVALYVIFALMVAALEPRRPAGLGGLLDPAADLRRGRGTELVLARQVGL